MITAQECIASTTPSSAGAGFAADQHPPAPWSLPVIPVSSGADRRLSIPDKAKYLEIPFNTIATITWELDDSLSDATFDEPGITMFGEQVPGGALHLQLGPDRRSITLTWPNTDPRFVSRSYYYRMHVVMIVNGVRLPLSHDPVVHNDPPG